MACGHMNGTGMTAAETASYHMDLQKSLEVMRFVIMKENQKLKEQLQKSRTGLADLSEQLDARADSPCVPQQPPSGPSSRIACGEYAKCAVTGEWRLAHTISCSRSPSCIEWCLRDVADVLVLGQSTTDSVQSFTQSFRLPAFADLDFQLRFYPWSPSSLAEQAAGYSALHTVSDAQREPQRVCELQLEVPGQSVSLELRIGLSIRIEGMTDMETSQPVKTVLSGGGRVSCVETWPSGWPACANAAAAIVICRAEIEELSWGPGHLSLRSNWQPPCS